MHTPPRVGKPKRAKPDEGATTPEIGTVGKRTGQPVMAHILKRIERMETAMRPYEPGWQECLSFFDNDQYVEVFNDGKLDRLETREGGAKPRHRPRLTRNRFTPAIISECAMVAGRAPVYECTGTSGDPKPTNAARFGEKALLAQYDARDVKGLAIDVAQYAHITGAGFSWPYWNSDVGEFIVGPTGEILREGEIGVHVLHQGEVGWQPGMDFYDARYYMVRKAQPVDEVMRRKGYIGPADLEPNAQSAPHEARRGEEAKDLAYIYHYLERPSDEKPTGRWLQLCQGQVIHEEMAYPSDYDEPCLQWLPYVKRRHRDRPLSLGEMMLDIQRTYNRTINQIVSYKNLVLNPQVFAPVGSLRQQLDDTPGAVWEFRPINGMRPEWREMPDLPVGLFRVLDQCIEDWREITGQQQLPAGVESGSGVQAINEREQSRRAVFVARLADWYARLGMAMLRLMQKHYTEDRLLILQGRFGVETLQDFRGAVLKGIAEVRVAAGSIEPRTRAAQQAIIMSLVDRQLVDPKKAIAALRSGTSDSIIDAYELNKAKQHREIQTFIQAGDMQAEVLPMVDPIVDDHPVHLEEIQMWMLTVDYERQPEGVKQMAQAHAGWHRQEQMNAELQQMQMTTMAAEQMGMGNAGRPQGPKPMPSQPSMESSANAGQSQGA